MNRQARFGWTYRFSQVVFLRDLRAGFVFFVTCFLF